MRFFIDENSHVAAAPILRLVYPKHEFRTYSEEGLAGWLDPDLIPELHSRGFQAIITEDKNQLADFEERAALRSAELHWIGVRKVPTPGIRGLMLTMSGLLAGFPFVLDAVGSASSVIACHVKRVPHDQGQRVKTAVL